MMTRLFFVLLLILLPCSSAFAEELELEIKTIHATSGEAFLNEGLATLENELTTGFPGYNRFELLSTSTHLIDQEASLELGLPDQDQSLLELAFKGRTEDAALLELEVGLKGKLSAEVKASPGSTFFQAGLLYKDGILILAIKPTLASKAQP